jgi:transcriptional regulator with XRE-family HTH domain
VKAKPAIVAPASGPTIAAGAALREQREAAGLSQRELARRVGVQANTVNKIEGGKTVPLPETREAIATVLGADQAELFAGFPARPATGQRPKYPPAPERTCEREGCDELVQIRHPSGAITRGRKRQGIYCSRECRIEALRKNPKPTERTCEREGCETRFTPKGAQLARGAGLYCSPRCWGMARPHPRAGALVACPGCGHERYRPPSHVARGYRYCSARCWARSRPRVAAETLAPLLRTLPPRVRQKALGRLFSRKAPAPGGRRRGREPVSVSDGDRRRILLASRRWGRRKISTELGLSEWAVRCVLDEDDKAS